MKKIILGLVVLSSITTFASEKVVRLDKNSIALINTNVECTRLRTWYGAKHVISLQTADGLSVDFTYNNEQIDPADCDKAKEEAMRAQSKTLIYLNSIKNGTLRVIEKKDSVVCARSYLDVAITEEGKLLNSVTGLTPVKCP